LHLSFACVRAGRLPGFSTFIRLRAARRDGSRQWPDCEPGTVDGQQQNGKFSGETDAVCDVRPAIGHPRAVVSNAPRSSARLAALSVMLRRRQRGSRGSQRCARVRAPCSRPRTSGFCIGARHPRLGDLSFRLRPALFVSARRSFRCTGRTFDCTRRARVRRRSFFVPTRPTRPTCPTGQTAG
jgi:hypothetical protein